MAEPVDIEMDLIDGDFTDDVDVAYEEEQQCNAYSASVEEMERRLADLRAGAEDDSERSAIRAIQQQKNELAFNHFTNVFLKRGYVLQKQDRIDLATFRAEPDGSIFARWNNVQIELTTVRDKSILKAASTLEKDYNDENKRPGRKVVVPNFLEMG